MNTTIGCPIPGASQPKEPVRLIDAYALKKRCVKVMFRDTPECGEFYAVGTGDIDIMPTIDPRISAAYGTLEKNTRCGLYVHLLQVMFCVYTV